LLLIEKTSLADEAEGKLLMARAGQLQGKPTPHHPQGWSGVGFFVCEETSGDGAEV